MGAAECSTAVQLVRLHLTSAPILHISPQAVDQFNALVGQVQKNTAQIERSLYAITRARLLPPDTQPCGTAPKPAATATTGSPEPAAADQQPASGARAGQADERGAAAGPMESQSSGLDVPDLQEWYEEFEQHRQQVRST